MQIVRPLRLADHTYIHECRLLIEATMARSVYCLERSKVFSLSGIHCIHGSFA